MAQGRHAWVDNLRTAMIVLVVNMHACVTYSHVGGWYRKEGVEPLLAAKWPFLLWQGHLQSFFMGLLFFLAGVFAHPSLERRGARAFLTERWKRLGWPSLLYMLVLHPLITMVLLERPAGHDGMSLGHRYWNYIASGRVLRGNGPLWFALALFMFCAVLALMRMNSGTARADESPRQGTAPGMGTLAAFGLILVVTTFAVRVVQPLGTNVLNFQLCYFPQYIAAFIAGVRAGRHGWLEPLAGSTAAARAGWTGVLGGPALMMAVLALLGPPGGSDPYEGGLNRRAFALALWEQSAGLCLGLGALALFRRHGGWDGPWSRWLSDHAFAVYVLHAPVMVALTPGLRSLDAGLAGRTLALTLLTLILTYAAASVARRIPGLRTIL